MPLRLRNYQLLMILPLVYKAMKENPDDPNWPELWNHFMKMAQLRAQYPGGEGLRIYLAEGHYTYVEPAKPRVWGRDYT